MAWLNSVRFVSSLGGLADFGVLGAVTGFQTPSQAGATNGQVYTYRAESADLTQWENGRGTWNSGTNTISRTTIVDSSSGGGKINFSTTPQVSFAALKQDILSFDEANTFSNTQKTQAQSNMGIPTLLADLANIQNGIPARFTVRGAGASVPLVSQDSTYYSTDDFGCVGDGVANDDTAFQNCVNTLISNGGGNLMVRGVLNLGQTFIMPSNVRIFSNNRFTNGFVLRSGVSLLSGLLQWANKSNVLVEDVGFFGNTTEPNPISTGALYFGLDLNATTDSLYFTVRNCYFQDWRQTAWIWVVVAAQGGGAVNRIRGVDITGNIVSASVGMAPTAGISGTNGNEFCRLTGNTLTTPPASYENTPAPAGSISDVMFSNNKIYGLGLSGALNVYPNVCDVTVFGNTTLLMGNNCVPEDRAYTYLFYNSDPTRVDPYNIVVSNNTGFGNHNNAVYAAGARNLTITGNVFTETNSSSVYPSLPHGFAIATNGAVDVTCTGNTLTGNPGGISYNQSVRPSRDVYANNIIRCSQSSVSLNPIGMIINPDSTAGSTDNKSVGIIDGNNIMVENTLPVGIVVNPTFQLGRIRITNNSIKSSYIGIYSTSTILATEFTCSGNTISGQLSNFAFQVQCGSSPLYIINETVDFSEVVAVSSGGYFLDSCTKLTVQGLKLANKANTGAALSAIGAQGRMTGVCFPGVTTTLVAATSLGLAKPSFSGFQGDLVQNLNPSELGAALSKYVVGQWINLGTTTWQDQRMLTGN